MRHSELPSASLRYASILVSVDLTAACEARIKLAADLSDRFEGRLIGCAAQPIVVPPILDPAGVGLATMIEAERQRILDNLAGARHRFVGACGTDAHREWRQDLGFAPEFIVQQSRAADLIVTNRPYSDETASVRSIWDAGDILMRAGRPILFVPPDIDHVPAKRIVIGWKDTREARRAAADALPLLTRSTAVTVFHVGADDGSVGDVTAYLDRHGVATAAVNRSVPETEAAAELLRFAEDQSADLIVCGGYGHSRAREWIFGGVTRDLLERAKLCCLLTH